MQCPSCGTALSEGAQRCPTCGRIFVSTPAPAAANQASVSKATPPQPTSARRQMPLRARRSRYPHLPRSRSMDLQRSPGIARRRVSELAGTQPSSSSGVARFLLGGIPLWIGIVAFLSVGATVLVGLLLRREVGHRRGGRSDRRRRWRRIDSDCGDSHSAGAPRAMVDAKPLGVPDARHGPWECGGADESADLSPIAGAESGEQQAVGGGHHPV